MTPQDVAPEARQQGVAHQLQDAGRPLIQELGFDTVVSEVLCGYTVAERNAFGWAPARRRATQIIVSLAEEK